MPRARKTAAQTAPTARKVELRPAPKPEYDEQKFKELILYLSEKSADDPSFGDTKLNKLLFLSDFLAYAVHGKSITGAVYQKLEWGPAPRRLLPARSELIEEDAATIVMQGKAYPRRVTVSKREADLSQFDTEELDLVNEVLDILRHHDASEVSDLSHRISAGWQFEELYADIPYDSIFLSVSTKLSPEEIERGQELAEKFDLQAA
jgi:hypothetical protein